MRLRHLAFALLLPLLPGLAHAKAWQGITPGASTQADVVNRFGEPSTRGKLEGRTAVVYKGDQAISGTKQAQFLVGEDGTVAEINVFPATQLDKDAVEGTYGKSAQKTFTDDFRPVWIYRPIGVMVFFGKEGFVEAIRFKAAEAGVHAAPPAQAAPRAAAPARPPAQADSGASAPAARTAGGTP
jgi:hypothetical protein